MGEKEKHKYNLLVVEDNPGDVRLIEEALIKSGEFEKNVFFVNDGEAAIRFLNRQDEFEQSPRPDLVLLDLNLPRVSGFDVLKYIKESEALSSIPVVILSTSISEEDINRSYNLHANAYIPKDIDIDLFFNSIHVFEKFWLSQVCLPNKN